MAEGVPSAAKSPRLSSGGDPSRDMVSLRLQFYLYHFIYIVPPPPHTHIQDLALVIIYNGEEIHQSLALGPPGVRRPVPQGMNDVILHAWLIV